jgi:hypothetical protein
MNWLATFSWAGKNGCCALAASYTSRPTLASTDRERKGSAIGYADIWEINAPSFAVALNWGMGSSSLNALVNAFERLHIVRGENSSYSGWKYSRCTSERRLRGASQLAIHKRGISLDRGLLPLRFFVRFGSRILGD